MALDHSRLGLENKFLEKKAGRIFLRSTGLLYKYTSIFETGLAKISTHSTT